MHRPDKWLRIWSLRDQLGMRYDVCTLSRSSVMCIPYMAMSHAIPLYGHVSVM